MIGSPGFEKRQFLILSRDGIRRLIAAAVHSRDADPIPFALWALALAMTPPAIYSVRMLFVYMGADRAASFDLVEGVAIANRIFFVTYGMIVSAVLAAFIWEALLPDRNDQEIVGVLPVRARTAAAARLVAATSILCVLALAISVPPGIVFALASASAYGIWMIPVLFVAHVVSMVLACLVIFLRLLIARGLVALIGGQSAAGALGAVLQLVTIVLLVETFLYLPAVLPALANRMLTGDPSVVLLPPTWFAGLYSLIVGTNNSAIVAGAQTALLAAAACVAIVVPVYLLPAAHLGRRALESRPRERSRGLTPFVRVIAPLFIPGAPVRAMFLFALTSLVRSRRHQVVLATYLGLGLAISGISFVAAINRRTLIIDEPKAYLLAIPLVMTFFAVFGLRKACATPTEVDANWPFRIAQPGVTAAVDATAAVMQAVAVVPVALVSMALFLMAGWSVRQAASAAIFDIASGLLLVETVLFYWSKIPFACASVPGPESLKSRWPLFLLALNLYAYQLDDFQMSALRSFRQTIVYLALIGGGAALVRFVRRRRERVPAIEFDLPDQTAVQTLGLSEAAR